MTQFHRNLTLNLRKFRESLAQLYDSVDRLDCSDSAGYLAVCN
ncbi:hypothetical protein ACVIGV_002056 [Rhizobium leguminosarum]